jgi:hypothetical protein
MAHLCIKPSPRDVNGWEMHYQEKSFLFQCKERFGVKTGERHVYMLIVYMYYYTLTYYVQREVRREDR